MCLVTTHLIAGERQLYDAGHRQSIALAWHLVTAISTHAAVVLHAVRTWQHVLHCRNDAQLCRVFVTHCAASVISNLSATTLK